MKNLYWIYYKNQKYKSNIFRLASLINFIRYSLHSKKPLKIDYDKESTDEIINKIAHSIEQHETFLKVIPQKELKKENELNKKREF